MSPAALAPFAYKNSQASEQYLRHIQPLLDCRLRGVIWYQGESNGSEWEYRSMLAALIEDWRAAFQNPDLAFHMVQLPPWNAEQSRGAKKFDGARDSQTMTVLQGRNSGLAVISDCGGDIHPNPKRMAGERLALAARGITYGEKIAYSGPMFKRVAFDGPKAVIEFNHVGGGLVGREMWLNPDADVHPFDFGGPGKSYPGYRIKEGSTDRAMLAGFAVCGPDEKYRPAQAEIVGGTVVVTSTNVAAVAGVRYGFLADSPFCNLFNRDGLPAAVFSTDLNTVPFVLSAGPGGEVSPGSGRIVPRMAPIPIRAAPAPNHVFTGWDVLKGTAVVADPKTADATVRIMSSAALRANFALRVACALAEPANPIVVKAGAKLKLAATAAVLQGDSAIRNVEFFRDEAKIGEAGAAPYACVWSEVPAGTHTVTARATDSTGLTATSTPVCVVATASGAWEGIRAEGGDVRYYVEGGANWTAHTFTSSGRLRVTSAGDLEYLVVAGGGGGGGTHDGGGGGAGGLLTGRLTVTKGDYTIQIGAGGTGEGRGVKSNGGDSFVARDGTDVVRAVGGGYGASSSATNPSLMKAANGGSGGGGAHGASKGAGVAGPPRQGHDGGVGGSSAGAGGGGAGGAGESSTSGNIVVRQGGPGHVSALRDGVTAVTYASGGRGRIRPSSEPIVIDGDSQEANTGDGGDGGSGSGILYGPTNQGRDGSLAKGGNGGSGIVIIRYVTGGK